MTRPRNVFKAALRERRASIGLWLSTGEPYLAEIAGHAGFDWLVIDAEHGPNDLRSILAQLQVLARFPVEAVVRPPEGQAWMLKQLLDLGARTLLVPMVNSAAQARDIVAAVRYPPLGVRGMGAMVARVSGFGTDRDYVRHADEDICLLVQVETRAGLQELEGIASVDGVDGVFIGPADLSADMGVAPDDPALASAIDAALQRLVRLGCPAGILTFDAEANVRYLAEGFTFVAVSSGVTVLSHALASLRSRFSGDPESADASAPSY